jgi:uncharacterized membrane protein YsdA (DUF1294 family)
MAMDSTYLPPVLILILLNIVAFACIDIDKRRARRGRNRIPEAVILLIAAIGGTIGTYLGCILFRHKVHKRGFTMALHLILTLQVLIVLSVLSAT